MGGSAVSLMEIAMTELIGARDDRGAHGTVLVRALRPGEVSGGINPQGEPHDFSV